LVGIGTAIFRVRAHYREPVSAALGDAFERITAERRRMTTEDAIAFARQHDD